MKHLTLIIGLLWALGASGQIFINSYRFGAAPSAGLLLDDYPNAAAAYSFRKLRTNYIGNCIVVRRSTNLDTLAVGFSGNYLDTIALKTFCASADCFIRIWYDQSTNANNAIQLDANLQFRIAQNGVITRTNGKVSMFGDEEYMQANSKIAASTVTAFIVHQGQSNGTNSTIFGFPAAANSHIGLYYWDNNVNKAFGFNTWVSDSWGYSNATSEFNSQSLWTALFINGNPSTSGVKLFRNGVQKSLSQIIGTSTSRIMINGLYIGRGGFPTNQDSNGFYQEIVVWDLDYSTTNRLGIESNINSFYNIY